MDNGHGVVFLEQYDGKRVCNILKNEARGNAIVSSNALYGSVCLPA
jgi:hypothetical protein